MKEKKHRRLKRLMLIAAVSGAAAWYSQLDESKKRFIKHLARQLPYLPARYYT